MGSGIRERRWLLVALLTTWGCVANSERQLTRAFEDAQLALRRGQLASAQSHAEKGAALAAARGSRDSHNSQEWAWRFRLLSAEIAINRRDLAAASPLLSAAVPEGSRFDAVRARQRYLQARTELLRGQPARALEILESARTLTADHLDIDVLDGQIRLQQGRWGEGESRLQQVAAAAAKSGDRFHQAVAFGNLGMGRLVRSRCDEALDWFERVLSFDDLEATPVYTAAMSNAGACYARLGQFERAVNVQQRAVELYEQRESRREYEQAVGELGSTFLLQDDVPRALPHLHRALAVATEAKVAEDAALWARNLAAAYVHAGQWDEAERFNDEARRLNPPSRANKLVFNTLHAAKIAAGRGQRDQARRLFTEVLAVPDGGPAVRWAAHDGLAGLALADGQPSRAARHFEAALDTIERTRSDLLKADYRLSFLSQLIRFYRAYVDALVAQGRFDRALEIADSSRGRVLAERHGVAAPPRMSATSIRRIAKESNAVLLSYWLTPTRSYVWMIGADAFQLRRLPAAGEIERLVREHQKVIADSLADPLAGNDSAGDRLYALLIEPFARSIPSGSTVIIVPDGTLHGLNFETLPVNGSRRRYLIEDAVVQIAPSLALLAGGSAPAAIDGQSVLLFGNASAHEPEFPALRFARTEMSNIARHFGPERVVTYQGEGASPIAYRDADASRFALIHFTAHAAANVESPLDSAIILSSSGSADTAFKLYARDVADRPLRAELVTVSACRSAGERAYPGEGLVGFAWAFLRAGARRVIAGLWDVDDRSTAELMDALYARLAAGETPARALRAAKLSLLNRGDTFAKPYYWAPFQLFTSSAAGESSGL